MKNTPSWVRASTIAASLAAWLLAPTSQAQAAGKGARVAAQSRGTGNGTGRNAARMNGMRGGGYGGMYRNRNAMAYQNNAAVVTQLHSTLTMLAQADHDYNGHRVRAMHHIGTAIRSLQPAAARSGQGNPAAAYVNNRNGNANAAGAGNGTGKGKMPQAASDQHLRQSLQALGTVESHLTNFGSTQHHVRARNSVQQAMSELNVALNIR